MKFLFLIIKNKFNDLQIRNKLLILGIIALFFYAAGFMAFFTYNTIQQRRQLNIFTTDKFLSSFSGNYFLSGQIINQLVHEHDLEELEKLLQKWNQEISSAENSLNSSIFFIKDKDLISKIQNDFLRSRNLQKEIIDSYKIFININNKLETLYDQVLDSRHQLSDMVEDTSEYLNFLFVRVGYFEKEFVFQYRDQERANQLSQEVENIIKEAQISDNQRLLNDAKQYQESINEIIKLVFERKNMEVYINDKIIKLFDLSANLEKDLERQKDIIEQQFLNSVIFQRKLFYVALIFIIIFVLASSAVVVIFSYYLSKPLRELSQTAQKIKKGKNLSIVPLFRKDEVGELSESFSSLLEHLRAEKNRAQKFLDVASTIIMAMDKRGDIKLLNQKGCDILGCANEKEAQSLNWFEDFTPADQKQKLKNLFSKIIKGGIEELEYLETPIKTKRGQEKIVAWHFNVLKDQKNKIKGILGSGIDITAHKKAQELLEESEEKYKTLVESIPACVKLFDMQGNLLSINNYGREEHYLEDKNEQEIKKWDYLKSIDKSYRNKVKRALTDATKGRSSRFELKHTTEGARNQYCYSIISPIKNAEGEVQYVLFLSVDISQRKKAQERIKSLDQLRNKFIQIVAHQLRTPLNSIRWNLESLLEQEFGKLKKEQEQFVRVTLKNSQNIIDTINNVLIAMDIEEGDIYLDKQKVSVESLTASAFGTIEKQCDFKKMKCDYRPSEEKMPEVEADAEKIRRVLDILVDNAVTYTKEKGKVVLNIAQKKDQIIFSVSDTGIGIPEAEQKYIFEKFYRASNATSIKQDASGLGLYIAKSFIEVHGGKIWFESQEGKGSTFYFSLPIK